MILTPGKRTSVLALLAILTSTILVNPIASAWSGPSATVSVFGGTANAESRRITVDKDGNIYTTGFFLGTTDFDPGPGIANLTAFGRDIFISKLDASGNYLWAKRFGGTGNHAGGVITVDGNGNIYVGGSFSNTVDFDPGAGTANLTSAKSEDAFILKLDANGNYLWAKSFGGGDTNAGYDGLSGIAVDVTGNVYAAGFFTGTVDFDSGEATVNRVATSDGAFILKLNAAGAFVWVDSFDGTGKDQIASLALDTNGDIYAGGSFGSSVDFNPNPLINETFTALNDNDAFILKLGSSGNFTWAKTFGVVTGGGYDVVRSVAVDIGGNVFATGAFKGRVDFDSSGGENFLGTTGNDYDIFVLKLNTSGGLEWAKSMGGASSDNAQGLTLDGTGNVYTTGWFQGSVDFDPTTGTFETLTATVGDAFISKLDSSGNYQWARKIGGTLKTVGRSIAADMNGNVYIAGFFAGKVDFDPGNREAFFTSASADFSDIFILKLNAAGEVDVAEAAVGYAKAVATVQAAAAKVAAEADAAAAKVAAEAAAAKREAEKASARSDIATAVKNAKDLTVDSFVKAEIPGINSSNIDALKAELLALPEESRKDFNQVLKVARKFEVVGNIASDQVQNILPNAFVEVGLISQTSKNKVALVSAVKKLPASARDSYAEIKGAIEAETKKIQVRQDRLASVIARNAARSSK